MAKHERDRGRGRRPGVVTAAKGGGPGRGFWIALGVLALLGITGLSWLASRPKVQATRLDPNLPANAEIVDLKLAPRNGRGDVESSADFYLLKPVDPGRGNGRLFYEVGNRGGKSLAKAPRF